MKEIVKIYTYAHKWSFEPNYEIRNTTYMPDCEVDRVVVPICEHEITVDIPEIDESKIMQAQVDQLKLMRKEVIAENHIRLKKIDDDIAKLMCLESK